MVRRGKDRRKCYSQTNTELDLAFVHEQLVCPDTYDVNRVSQHIRCRCFSLIHNFPSEQQVKNTRRLTDDIEEKRLYAAMRSKAKQYQRFEKKALRARARASE